MTTPSLLRPTPIFSRIGLAVLSVLLSASSLAQSPGRDDQSGPMLRFLCVTSLTEDEELVIASRDEEGAWTEHGAVELRSSFISPWVKSATGVIHLTRRQATGLVSVASLRVPDRARRAIVILLAEAGGNGYRVNLINPDKLGFAKGRALVANYSRTPATVMLGGNRMTVQPGEKVVARAAVTDEGMYRLLAGYRDAEGQLVACYDRYVSANPEAREFLLLFPDETTGLRVFSLPEFGPFK